ncbi:MAG: hypothetical protein ACI8TX_000363, partial [Hyphomicrobiaceae bacterium]
GYLGLADRPFATPGEVLEIAFDQDGCEARSAGLESRSGSDYTATLAFKPHGAERAELVVLTPDCSQSRAALAVCEANDAISRVSCIDSTPAKGPDALTPLFDDDGTRAKKLRFRFPDTDSLVDGPVDGRTLTGPVAIAVSRTIDGPVCELASETCRDIGSKHSFVACVDELSVGDGSCGVGTNKRHRSFGHFTALPPSNDAAALLAASHAGGSGADSSSEIRLALDAEGIALLPVDWRAVRKQDREAQGHDGRLRGHDALKVLAKMLATNRDFDARNASLFTPTGRQLPPAYSPDGPTSQLSLFDWIEVPLTVVRLAPRLCTDGPRSGLSCTGDAACEGSLCGPALFLPPSTGTPAARPVVLAISEDTVSLTPQL